MSWPPQRVRWWRQAVASGASGAPERGYLPADGVNDYGVAWDGALGAAAAGTAGQFCLITKLNSADPGLNSRVGGITDTTGSPSNIDFGALAAYLFSSASTQYRLAAQSFSRAGVNDGAFAYTFPTPDAPVVVAHSVANGGSARGFFARAGVTLATSPYTPATSRVPEHVAVATTIRSDLLPATAGAAALQWRSTVILNREPTSGEIAAYSASDARDARLIWPSAIHAYWAAGDAVGTSVPARVGAVPMTLVGGWNSTDLVLS